MGDEMNFEISLISERFLAGVALERFLSRVRSKVVLIVAAVCQSSAAERTHISLRY